MRRPGTAMALGLAAERRCTRGFWRLVLPEFRAMHQAAREEPVRPCRCGGDCNAYDAPMVDLSDALARQMARQMVVEYGPLAGVGECETTVGVPAELALRAAGQRLPDWGLPS